MLNIVSNFSRRNDDKFNDNFLLNMRAKDTMVKYIDNACEVISRLAPDNIKYNGYYINKERSKLLEMNQGKGEKVNGKVQNGTIIHINDTSAQEVIFEFDCTYGGQTVKNKMSLWIPTLIDPFHFYIRGNKYAAPIQIIDAITFTKRNILILKTMTRAIKFERCKETLTDIYGSKYYTNSINIYISNKKISFLMYYFAFFGFFKTLKYFGVDDIIKIYSGNINSGVPEDKILFKFGSMFLGVDKESFLNRDNVSLRSFIASILITSKRTIDSDFLHNSARWTLYLGETINPLKDKALKKGHDLLKTFIVSLDYQTKTNINQLVEGKDRNNSFAVGRWIFCNYSKLCAKDDGLHTKRMRLSEYLISPFIRKFVDNAYRFINTTEKNKDINLLNNIFKIKSNIIINSIIGKISVQATGLNIAKFSSATNDNALFNTGLNVTKSGPGSPMEKSKLVGTLHRQIYADSIGVIDIIGGTSNNEPGIGGHISPQADIDIDKMIFKIDPMMIKK